MKFQAALKPDIYQALCDSDTDRESGKKRLNKSVERTLRFLDKCIEEHEGNQVGHLRPILGVNVLTKFVTAASAKPVEGFIQFHDDFI